MGVFQYIFQKVLLVWLLLGSVESYFDREVCGVLAFLVWLITLVMLTFKEYLLKFSGILCSGNYGNAKVNCICLIRITICIYVVET
jgi:hypothetical protein